MFGRNKHRVAQGERFLSRWSRRKLKRSSDTAIDAGPVLKPDAEPSDQPEETVSSASEALPLPTIESLDESSDYSGFLSPDVCDEVQRLALRKLFSSSGFNVRDGLDDYDEDYRIFESLGDTLTADMRHRMERKLGEAFNPENKQEDESAGVISAAESSPEQAATTQNEEDKSPESSPSSTGNS